MEEGSTEFLELISCCCSLKEIDLRNSVDRPSNWYGLDTLSRLTLTFTIDNREQNRIPGLYHYRNDYGFEFTQKFQMYTEM